MGCVAELNDEILDHLDKYDACICAFCLKPLKETHDDLSKAKPNYNSKAKYDCVLYKGRLMHIDCYVYDYMGELDDDAFTVLDYKLPTKNDGN